jgi:uncharacterized coiled-coil protein SlyX
MAAVSHIIGDAERQSSVDKLKLSQREWEKKGMEKMVAEDKESMERLKQQMKLSEEAFKTAQEAAGTNDGERSNLRL